MHQPPQRSRRQISDSSLDTRIPSFPSSPRSIPRSDISLPIDDSDHRFEHFVNALQCDKEFLTAAHTGRNNIMDLIISKGVNINQIDYLGRSALHLAIIGNGNERTIHRLLTAGINLNIRDNMGATPLSLCLLRRLPAAIVSLLLQYGAHIDKSSPSDTGLFLQFVMMAVPTNEETQILRILLEHGAVLEDPNAPGGRQALHYAAMSNNCKLIKLLIEMGADIHVKNHRNETPRNTAASFKCIDAERLLQSYEPVPKSFSIRQRSFRLL